MGSAEDITRWIFLFSKKTGNILLTSSSLLKDWSSRFPYTLRHSAPLPPQSLIQKAGKTIPDRKYRGRHRKSLHRHGQNLNFHRRNSAGTFCVALCRL